MGKPNGIKVENGKNKTEQRVPFTEVELSEAELNACYCVQVFEEGIAPAIEKITPSLNKAFHDFSRLSKGEMIMGCKTQDEWAQKNFKRTARAVRYMFSTEEQKEERRLVERERRAKAHELPQSAAEQSETPLPHVGDFVQLTPKETSPAKPEPRSDSSHGEKIPETNTVGPESATPEPSQRDSLHKAYGDLLAFKAWIKQLQSLMRDINPRASCWTFMNQEQRDKWEWLVEREP